MSMSDCMSCQKNVFRFFRRQLLCIIWLLVPTVATSSQFAQCLIQRWLAACLLKTILELQNCTGCYSFPLFYVWCILCMETLSWDHAVFPLYLPGVRCTFGAKEMCLICMFSGFVFLCHTPSTSYWLSLKKLTDSNLSFISASQTACNALLFVTYAKRDFVI